MTKREPKQSQSQRADLSHAHTHTSTGKHHIDLGLVAPYNRLDPDRGPVGTGQRGARGRGGGGGWRFGRGRIASSSSEEGEDSDISPSSLTSHLISSRLLFKRPMGSNDVVQQVYDEDDNQPTINSFSPVCQLNLDHRSGCHGYRPRGETKS